MMHEVDLAIYRTVHEHGGAVRLATRLGMRPGTLNNKADPAMESHQLNVREAIAAQLATKTRHIIKAEANSLNGVFVPAGDWSRVSDMQLLDGWAKHQELLGQFAHTIRAALNGGTVRRRDLQAMRRAIYSQFEAAMELYSRFEGLCNEPPHESEKLCGFNEE